MGAPMTKIAIVVGNPMRDSYSEALGQAYLRGAESGGHEAKLFLLARMNFDAILREGYRREQPLEPDLVAARQALKASDHLVFVLSLIHISEPTRRTPISYAVFCLKKKNT